MRDAEAPLVLHDALCPMTPPDFIAACVRRAVDEDVVVVGVRPVTDTVKVASHDGAASARPSTATASAGRLPARAARDRGRRAR